MCSAHASTPLQVWAAKFVRSVLIRLWVYAQIPPRMTAASYRCTSCLTKDVVVDLVGVGSGMQFFMPGMQTQLGVAVSAMC